MGNVKESYSAASVFPVKLIKKKELCVDGDGNIKPVHVQFCPTNKCNLNCPFCSCSERERQHELELNTLANALCDLADLGMKSVTITGGGEPCMYPWLSDIIRYLHDLHVGVGLVSNGLLLDSIQDVLPMVTWCRVSVSDFRDIDKLLDKMGLIVPGANIDWAFSYVLTDKFDFSKFIKCLAFANVHKFTHVRLVSDIMNPGKTPPMYGVKEDVKESGLDDSIVIYQEREESTPGVKGCRISLLKPLIAPDGYLYPCCLDENETVLIRRDNQVYYETIKDVKIGDIAEGYGEIVNVFRKPAGKSLEIVLANNRTIRVSPDHVMLTGENIEVINKRKKLIGRYDLYEVEAKDIKTGDLIPVKYAFEQHNSSQTINELEAEFIGYYMAEGWSNDAVGLVKGKYPVRKTNIGFGFGKHEIEYHKRFESICDQLGFNYSKTERRTTMQYSVGMQKPYDDLIVHCGRKDKKHIPSFILNSTKEVKLAFLKSYFYGDGHFLLPSKGFDGYQMRMSTVSRRLANDIVYLFATLGIFASIRIDRREGQSTIEDRSVNIKDRYCINVGGSYNLEKVPFLNVAQTKKRSPRRALGFLKNIDDCIMLVPVKEIREIESTGMVDLQVSGTNMFIGSFGIIVHNCGVQYAQNNNQGTFPENMRMCHISEIKSFFEKQAPFNGLVCDRCYYGDYNASLAIMTRQYDHEVWV